MKRIKNPYTYMEDLTIGWKDTNSFWKKFVRNLFWEDTFENDLIATLVRAFVWSIVVNLVLFLIALYILL